MYCTSLLHEAAHKKLLLYLRAHILAERDPVLRDLLHRLCDIEEWLSSQLWQLPSRLDVACKLRDTVESRIAAARIITRLVDSLRNLVVNRDSSRSTSILLSIHAYGTRTSAKVGVSLEDERQRWSTGISGDLDALCKPVSLLLTARVVVNTDGGEYSYVLRFSINVSNRQGRVAFRESKLTVVKGLYSEQLYEEDEDAEEDEYVVARATCRALRLFKPYAVI